MGLMDLGKAREGYEYHSGRASEITRQLGFAGIALVWIFRTGDVDGGPLTVPVELIAPSILLVAALSADFLHYVSAAITWGIYTRVKERQLERDRDIDRKFSAPRQLNWPGNFFFLAKLFAISFAYLLILVFLFASLPASPSTG